jgi:ABC-2 type transport system ATP-binding protein
VQSAVEINNFSVSIDEKPILSNISAEIPNGKIIGLLGPSGAGKTTLIRSILGLQKPSSGQITVLGQTPGAKSVRAKTGYVTQAPSVYPDLTVEGNLDYFSRLLGLNKQTIEHTLRQVELTPNRNQMVSSLSGGQKTRVSLAVALLGSPELLLLDEPTVGLDPLLRQKLWGMFRDLSAKSVSIIVTSHVMDEADRCDGILFIRGGKLLISGSKARILETSKTKTMEDAFLKLSKRRK